MEINIVGSITDEDTLDEIQHIAKIFVYEQHMKGFNYPKKIDTNFSIKKDDRKNKNQPKSILHFYSKLQVKGLC
ncbi:MAG: hypothetical protein R6V50_04900 [Thermoplasmatota archaeon]